MTTPNTIFVAFGLSWRDGTPNYGVVCAWDLENETFRAERHVDLGDGDTYWDTLTMGDAGNNRAIVVTEGEPHNAFLYDLSTWTRGSALPLTGAEELNRQTVYDPVDDAFYFINDNFSIADSWILIRIDVGAWTVSEVELSGWYTSNFYPYGDGVAIDHTSGYIFGCGYEEATRTSAGQRIIRVTIDPFEFYDSKPIRDYFSDIAGFVSAGYNSNTYSIHVHDGYLYAVGVVNVGSSQLAPFVLKVDPGEMSLVARYIDLTTLTIDGSTYGLYGLVDFDFDDDGNLYACGSARSDSAPTTSSLIYKIDAATLTTVEKLAVDTDHAGNLQGMLVHEGIAYVGQVFAATNPTDLKMYRIDCASMTLIDAQTFSGVHRSSGGGGRWGPIVFLPGYVAPAVPSGRRWATVNINMRRRWA